MVRKSVNNDSQLLLIVNGTAGTGKSYAISAISHALSASFVVRCAFTAKAAYLIRGSTLHSQFQLPVEQGSRSFCPLQGKSLVDFQKKFELVKLVIIDEYSMLGKPMLAKIDLRLRQAKACNRLFGGISVVLVGDPAQLPPVMDSTLYSESCKAKYSNEGAMAYSQFRKVITLDQLQRQVVEEGDERQQLFLQTLTNIRNGKVTEADFHLLKSLVPNRNTDYQQGRFSEAIRLYATNEKVDSYNYFKLQILNQPITRLVARNTPYSAKKFSSEVFRGIQNDLFLCVGAKVTLLTNILPRSGLTNGSQGTVVDIIYMEGKKPNEDLPNFIVVYFPEYTGAQFFEDESYKNYIPLPPMKIDSEDHRCSRLQFPVRLAYALTIHKSQGQTLNRLYCDLGTKEMTTGLTFVALSRVRHVRDLTVEEFSFGRLVAINKSKLLAARLAEERRLEQLSNVTLAHWTSCGKYFYF